MGEILERYAKKSGKAIEPAPMKRVATVAVMHDGHLLMGKRRDNGKWTTPGGHADKGEELHAAAVRELEEESGLKAHHSHVQPMAEAKTVTNDKGEKVQVQPFRYDVPERPSTSMKQDPDAEVHRWQWVDTSKGLPDDIKNNLHVPADRNCLLQGLGLHGDGEMKDCGALGKYMKTKGMKMDADKRHDPEAVHEGSATDLYSDKQTDQDGIHDREGAKSRKATKHLDRYQKMKGMK